MKKKLLLVLVSLAMAASAASFTVASGLPNDSGASQGLNGQPVVLEGKVVYIEPLAGYYVQSQNQPGSLMIENQNPALLEKMMKKGETLTINGRFRMGADILSIEKIDGQAYRGK
jgi:hypothetical protein